MRGALAFAVMFGVASAQCQTPPARQRLNPCEADRPGLKCGSLKVFEDRAAARGRTLDLHFAVAPADIPRARVAVFVLAGGPGEGSISLSGSADGWLRPLRATSDLVFVDQRGTGESNALMCPSSAAADPASAFGHVFNPAAVARCQTLLNQNADLAKYTTDDAAEDLDAVRAALGYDRIAIYGASYGTRLAQAYMRRFPSRVRSAVLDGVVPFDNVVPLTYAASAQNSLARVFAACAQTPECHAIHPDLGADFDRLLHRFDRGSIVTAVAVGTTTPTVRMNRGDFGYAVRGILYGANAALRLPDMIARAAGSGDLSEFATYYWSREVVMDREIAFGLHLSVFCSEDIPFASDKDIATATAGTFLGRYLFDEYREACADWPRGYLAADARAPVTVRVPTLLVSGAFDPVTPPAFADRVARSLPIVRPITAPRGSHGSATGCPRAAVLYVLDHGTLDGLPAVCR